MHTFTTGNSFTTDNIHTAPYHAPLQQCSPHQRQHPHCSLPCATFTMLPIPRTKSTLLYTVLHAHNAPHTTDNIHTAPYHASISQCSQYDVFSSSPHQILFLECIVSPFSLNLFSGLYNFINVNGLNINSYSPLAKWINSRI